MPICVILVAFMSASHFDVASADLQFISIVGFNLIPLILEILTAFLIVHWPFGRVPCATKLTPLAFNVLRHCSPPPEIRLGRVLLYDALIAPVCISTSMMTTPNSRVTSETTSTPFKDNMKRSNLLSRFPEIQ